MEYLPSPPSLFPWAFELGSHSTVQLWGAGALLRRRTCPSDCSQEGTQTYTFHTPKHIILLVKQQPHRHLFILSSFKWKLPPAWSNCRNTHDRGQWSGAGHSTDSKLKEESTNWWLPIAQQHLPFWCQCKSGPHYLSLFRWLAEQRCRTSPGILEKLPSIMRGPGAQQRWSFLFHYSTQERPLDRSVNKIITAVLCQVCVSNHVSNLKGFVNFSHFVVFTTSIKTLNSITDEFLLKPLLPDHITGPSLIVGIIKILFIEWVESVSGFAGRWCWAQATSLSCLWWTCWHDYSTQTCNICFKCHTGEVKSVLDESLLVLD